MSVEVEIWYFCASDLAVVSWWQYCSATASLKFSSYVHLAHHTVKCLWQSTQRHLCPPVGSWPFFWIWSLWQNKQSNTFLAYCFIEQNYDEVKKIIMILQRINADNNRVDIEDESILKNVTTTVQILYFFLSKNALSIQN